MLINLPRGRGRGTWQRVLFHTPEPEFRGYWSAIVTCPECGEKLNCVNHSIAADGQITPSLGHPVNTGCAWHTNPRLLGWLEGDGWDIPMETAPQTCDRCSKQAHTIGGWGTWSGGSGIICRECFQEHSNAIAAIQRERDSK